MWKKRDRHLVDIYKITKDETKINELLFHDNKRKMVNSSTTVYQGNDFDVFGKEPLEESYPLYSLEHDTLPRIEFKRGQTEDLSDIIKKRRKDVAGDGIFIVTKITKNAPIPNIFTTKNDTDNDDDDLAYY